MDRATAVVLAQFRQDTSDLAREAMTLAQLAETLCDAAEAAASQPLAQCGRGHLRVVKGLVLGGAAAMAAARKLAVGAGAAAVAASVTAIVAVPLVTATPVSPRPAAHVTDRDGPQPVEPAIVPARGMAPAGRQHAMPMIRPAPPALKVITAQPSPTPAPTVAPLIPSPTPVIQVSVSPPVLPSPSPSQSVCVAGLVCLGL